MLPKIIRTGIHQCEGTGVRKTEMATQYRKAYVPVTLDVDKEGAILPRLIWWDNGAIFQIDQILYKCRATSKKVGGGGIRYTVAVPTFASYSTTVKKIVAPYFREKEVTLKNLTAKDIQEFYLSELERVSPSSVIHYHANIHKALKYAVKIDLIDVNPADKVERPKKTATSAASMMPMRSTLFSRLQKEANLSFRFCSVRSTVYAGAKQSV